VLSCVQDREEALKDDYPLEDSAYDDEDEEDEWAGDDTAWNDETEVEEDTDARDESSAYLEFLNEEASLQDSQFHPSSNLSRLKNSKIWKITIQMTSLERKAFSRHHLTRLSLINSSETPFSVSGL